MRRRSERPEEPKCPRQPALSAGRAPPTAPRGKWRIAPGRATPSGSDPEPVPAKPATAFVGRREQGFAKCGARWRIARRICLEDLGYYPEWMIRVLVISRLLTGRQFDLGMRQFLVRNLAEDVGKRVQPRPPLVVRRDDVPWRPGGVGREKHLVA